jgi:UbiA prenyltransferase family
MKKNISYLIDFIARSNAFVSCCAFFFTKYCLSLIGQMDKVNLSLFPWLVAVGVFFIYGLQRIIESKKNKSALQEKKHDWYRQHFSLMMFLVVASSIILLTLFFTFYSVGFLKILPPLFISILYFAGPKPLKSLTALKGFFIGITWSYVCAVLPVLLAATDADWMTLLPHAISMFCFISALCIPFDIRDRDSDIGNGIKSLPVTVGVNSAKFVAVSLLLASLMIEFFCFTDSLPFLSLSLTSLVGLFVVFFSSSGKHPYYFSLLAEGILFLPYTFLQLLEWIHSSVLN